MLVQRRICSVCPRGLRALPAWILQGHCAKLSLSGLSSAGGGASGAAAWRQCLVVCVSCKLCAKPCNQSVRVLAWDGICRSVCKSSLHSLPEHRIQTRTRKLPLHGMSGKCPGAAKWRQKRNIGPAMCVHQQPLQERISVRWMHKGRKLHKRSTDERKGLLEAKQHIRGVCFVYSREGMCGRAGQ